MQSVRIVAASTAESGVMLRMARPQKTGLDYFPVDVDIFSDIKIRVVMARFGADGFTFYMYLLSRIYRDGFYTKADEDFLLIASADLQMSIDKIGQMLNFFFERSLLDSKLFGADKTLTSNGIQRRYQEAIKSRASKKSVAVDGRHWLLKAEDTEPFIRVRHNDSFSEINPSKSEKNPNKSEIYSTKESKEKESKGEESSVPDKSGPPSPAREKQKELIEKYGPKTVESYMARANAYNYIGDKAIYKAAQWLTEDETAGKIKQKRQSSLDMDAYKEASKNYIPEF